MLLEISNSAVRKLNATRYHLGKRTVATAAEVASLLESAIEESMKRAGVPVDASGNPINDFDILRTVSFVYDKGSGSYRYPSEMKWRTVKVTDEDDTYIRGYEDGTYKQFLKSKIFGGKILTLA